MKKIESFRDLTVWQESHELVLEAYKATQYFPEEEKFGLISQMRRSAVSFPANIAEGFKRRGKKDKIYFYNISQGSLSELHYYVILAKDLGFRLNLNKIDSLINEIGRMLRAVIASLENSPTY
ncbi:MAG: four helix bundle protein [Candidatus Omnitrophica bacterium]|nr:four helix bundle protein [Candidatus Omnitrophota bacterium]